MIPVLTRTKVDIMFHTKTFMAGDINTRFLYTVSRQPIVCCSLVLTNEQGKYVVTVSRKKGMFLVPWSNWEFFNQTKKSSGEYFLTSLGTAPVSLSLILSLVDRPEWKTSSLIGDIFWWVIGRWIFRSYEPQTCCTVICHILRVCGFKIGIHVEPHKLFKEVSSGVDNHFWNGEGRKNYLGEPDSSRGI
jgi:hypothetical protein